MGRSTRSRCSPWRSARRWRRFATSARWSAESGSSGWSARRTRVTSSGRA